MLDESIQRRLRALGTSTLYEAGRPFSATRALDPAIRPLWPGATACGVARPVECAERDNLAIHRAIEQCRPGDVLVVDGKGAIVGYWGEILTAAAQARAVAGLVVDGGARDVDALERRRFPVFARGVGMTGADKRRPGRLGEPIRLGGTPVGPGEVVVADGDGVLIVDAARVTDVLAAAEQRAADEDSMMRELAAGALTMDLLGLRDRSGD